MLHLGGPTEALDGDRPAIESHGSTENAEDATIVGTAGNDVLYGAAASPAVDQQFSSYSGGLSARNLPGDSYWQSFTAGDLGHLSQIDAGFFATPSSWKGFGDLKLYSGDGTNGALLYEGRVAMHAQSDARDFTWDHWAVNAKVTAGHVYTFELTPESDSVPDPYGLAIGQGYAGGEMGSADAGGSYSTNFDWDFKTVVKGSSDDVLSGQAGNDKLFGLLGADTLSGGSGSDLLVGGRGVDVMSGGSGNDVFRYDSVKDSLPGHADLITDLSVGDRIDLSRIDANTQESGDQAFHIVHGSLSGVAGELLLVYHPGQDFTSVRGDVNGDAVADFRIDISGDWSGFTHFVL